MAWVVIPARNAAAFIAEAIAPFVGMPDITGLVVVDDGSTDQTLEVARKAAGSLCLHTLKQERTNQYAALNAGLQLVDTLDTTRTAPVILRDADDVTDPEALREQLALLRTEPDLLAVGGGTVEMDANGRLLGPENVPAKPVEADPVGLATRSFCTPFWPATAVFRPGVFREIGGFWPVPTMGDADLCMRLCFMAQMRNRRVRNLRVPVIRRRIHPASVQATIGSPNSPVRAAIQAWLGHQRTFFATMARQDRLTRELLWRPLALPVSPEWPTTD